MQYAMHIAHTIRSNQVVFRCCTANVCGDEDLCCLGYIAAHIVQTSNSRWKKIFREIKLLEKVCTIEIAGQLECAANSI